MLVKINEKVLANNNLLLSNIKQDGWRKMQKIYNKKQMLKESLKLQREKKKERRRREKKKERRRREKRI